MFFLCAEDDGSLGPPKPPGVFVSAKIDINKFSQFLYGDQILPTNVICSMCFKFKNFIHVIVTIGGY